MTTKEYFDMLDNLSDDQFVDYIQKLESEVVNNLVDEVVTIPETKVNNYKFNIANSRYNISKGELVA